MCGICVFLFSNQTYKQHQDKIGEYLTNSRLHCRGPDIQSTSEKELTASIFGVFYGSTLHFRGQLTQQPLEDKDGNILLWNGEIFAGLEVSADENDGVVLLKHLSHCDTDEDLLRLFSKIQGPWAFVYWKALTRQLWFSRDIFGRRSLLYQKEADGSLILASVAIRPWSSWQEVPALGVYCIMVDYLGVDDSTSCLKLYPWAAPNVIHIEGILSDTDHKIYNTTLMQQSLPLLSDLGITVSQTQLAPQLKPFNRTLPEHDEVSVKDAKSIHSLDSLASDHQKELAVKLISVLTKAVNIRTSCQSNQCSRCIQRQLSQQCLTSLNNSDISRSSLHDAGSCQLMTNRTSSVDHSSDGPMKADKSSNLNASYSACGHARVAILFSGGIDSLLIAALVDRCVPADEPVDLLNVAFEQQATTKQQKKCQQASQIHEQSFSVPDRVTGLSGLNELVSLNPNRKWNFVQIDISLKELQEARAEHVKDLVYPLSTVLDDSIGCAIWFASRGKGFKINELGESILYTSHARVVLVGMGADEQLVGYSRHRIKYSSSGWKGLIDEIQMEIERISSRNLGRDDRVISDNSREARFPFLDENVVSFLSQLPLHEKANLNLPRGIGEKFLLRLAAERLGLKKGAMAPKRAIQFGSRIAKAENRKEKGSDNCARLQ